MRTPRRGESSDWQCQLGSAFLARLQILEEEGEGKKRIVGRREKRQKRALAKGTKVTVFQTEEHSASFCQIKKKKKDKKNLSKKRKRKKSSKREVSQRNDKRSDGRMQEGKEV